MKRFGKQFLAGASFTEHEDRNIMNGDPLRQVHLLAHRGTAMQDLAEVGPAPRSLCEALNSIPTAAKVLRKKVASEIEKEVR